VVLLGESEWAKARETLLKGRMVAVSPEHPQGVVPQCNVPVSPQHPLGVADCEPSKGPKEDKSAPPPPAPAPGAPPGPPEKPNNDPSQHPNPTNKASGKTPPGQKSASDSDEHPNGPVSTNQKKPNEGPSEIDLDSPHGRADDPDLEKEPAPGTPETGHIKDEPQPYWSAEAPKLPAETTKVYEYDAKSQKACCAAEPEDYNFLDLNNDNKKGLMTNLTHCETMCRNLNGCLFF